MPHRHVAKSTRIPISVVAVMLVAWSTTVGCSKGTNKPVASGQTAQAAPKQKMVRREWAGTPGDSSWWSKADHAHANYPPLLKRVAYMFEADNDGTFFIPEYNDTQRFYADESASTYGPIAKIFASPYLSALSDIDQVNAYGPGGALAAVTAVIPDPDYPINGAYQSLGMPTSGTYCVTLAHSGPNKTIGWSSLVYPPPSSGQCTQPTDDVIQGIQTGHLPPGVTLLTVATTAGGGTDRGADYPPVARWGQDEQLRPIILIKCLALTCELMPSGSDYKPGGPWNGINSVEGRVKLWHDEQRLAVKDGNGRWVPSAVRGSVVPEHNLGLHDKGFFLCAHHPCQPDEGWQKVATIVLAGDLTGTPYGDSGRWNMKSGHNVLWLRKNGVGSDDDDHSDWDARITDDDPHPTTLKTFTGIARHSHWDSIVPGTARFAWGADEGVWVSCAMGCCQVDIDQ